MKTLGIDLAAQPMGTAACVVDWRDHSITWVDRPTHDDALVEAALSVDFVGIDVPLGWPDGFVAAVTSHHSNGGWPPADDETPGDRDPLRFRLTDRRLREAGKRPLSVSTDLIGVTALRGARILEFLQRRGAEVDRSGMTGLVAEVYPAAALDVWGLPHSGYKGRAKRDRCREIGDQFAALCGPVADGVTACLADADADDHELDALICAFVAKAVRDGATSPPRTDEEVEIARREGWIHVPTCSSPADLV